LIWRRCATRIRRWKYDGQVGGAGGQASGRSLNMADERQIADEELQPAPVIAPGYTFGTVTDQIASVVLTRRTPVFWIACFAGGFSLLLLFLWSVALLLTKGVGIWGIRIPVGWGFAITNFVWWIGIGHAGTLI